MRTNYFFHFIILFFSASIAFSQVSDFQVNENGGLSHQWKSQVAVDGSGNYIVVWEDHKNVPSFDPRYSPGGDIYMKHYTASGELIWNDTKVSEFPTQGFYAIPSISANASGSYVISWMDATPDSSIVYGQRFSSGITPFASIFRVNEVSGYVGMPSNSVAMNDAGRFVIAWTMSVDYVDKVMAQIYDADGSPVGSNFEVATFVGKGDQRYPSAVMHSDGSFVIAWEGGYTEDRKFDIFCQMFAADGTPIDTIKVVDVQVEEEYVHDAKIAMDDDGNFLVIWSDARNNYNQPDIYGQWFDNSGARLGDNFIVNPDGAQMRQNTGGLSVSMDSTGSYTVAWDSYAGPLLAQRFSGDSTRVGGPIEIINGYVLYLPGLGMQKDGSLLVTWDARINPLQYSSQSSGDIYGQLVNVDSTLVGTEFKIKDDAGTGQQINPSIAVNEDGDFVVAWQDPSNDDSDIYVHRFSSLGTPYGSQAKVNDDPVFNQNINPVAAYDSSGSFLVVWEDYRGDYSDIYGQLFSSEGVKVGTNFMVSAADHVGYISYSAMASGKPGVYVIIYGLDGQLISSAGEAIGDPFVLYDGPIATGYNPCIAANDSGVFVTAWSDARNGKLDIYAQLFSPEGAKIGINFKVTDEVTNVYQYRPDAAMHSDSSFVITWVDKRSGTYDFDIYAQRFDPSGVAIGANFKVNDQTLTETLYYPTVAIAADGSFIIAWEDKRNDLGDIYAQDYTKDGIAIGENYLLTNTGYGTSISPDISIHNSVLYAAWSDNRNFDSGFNIWASVSNVFTGIEEIEEVPTRFSLYPNYPNPFNPSTTIRFQLAHATHVQLDIFNNIGQRIATLVNGSQGQGYHQVVWNGLNDKGIQMPSGVYYYRIQTANYTRVMKMVMVK